MTITKNLRPSEQLKVSKYFLSRLKFILLQYIHCIAKTTIFSIYFNVAERPTRARGFDVLSTNPHANADPRRIVGEGGKDVKLLANYFEIKKRGSPTFYKHHVEFDPEVLAPRYRAFLLAQHRERLGGYLFVGNDIFLVEPLSTDSQPVVFESKNRDNETFKLTIKQTKTVKMTEPEHFQVLNLILHRAMNTLDLQQIKRGHFDPKGKVC